MKYSIGFYKLFLLFLIISCSKDPVVFFSEPAPDGFDTIYVTNCIPQEITEPNIDFDKASIRIRNYSKYELCNMEYGVGFETFRFGSLLPGEYTDFVGMEEAYSYPGYIRFEFADTFLVRNAIDYFGESLLAPGLYNYNISLFRDKDDINFVGVMFLAETDKFYSQDNYDQCIPHQIDDCGKVEGMTNLRIINESIFHFCNFSYDTGQEHSYHFGNIPAGTSSCYTSVDVMMNFPYQINLQIGEYNLSNSNMDIFEYAESIPPGNYTCHMTVLGYERISMSLVKDD